MFTKGIDYYVFLDINNFTATFSASGFAPVSYSANSSMRKGNFQLARDLFEWRVGTGTQDIPLPSLSSNASNLQ